MVFLLLKSHTYGTLYYANFYLCASNYIGVVETQSKYLPPSLTPGNWQVGPMTSAGIIIILVIISWRQRNWVVVGFNVPRLPLLLLSAASMFGDNSQRQRSGSAAAAPAQTTTKPILRSNCDVGSAASANGQKQRCNPVPVRVLVCVSGSHGCMCVSRATICGASCALSAARNS